MKSIILLSFQLIAIQSMDIRVNLVNQRLFNSKVFNKSEIGLNETQNKIYFEFEKRNSTQKSINSTEFPTNANKSTVRGDGETANVVYNYGTYNNLQTTTVPQDGHPHHSHGPLGPQQMMMSQPAQPNPGVLSLRVPANEFPGSMPGMPPVNPHGGPTSHINPQHYKDPYSHRLMPGARPYVQADLTHLQSCTPTPLIAEVSTELSSVEKGLLSYMCGQIILAQHIFPYKNVRLFWRIPYRLSYFACLSVGLTYSLIYGHDYLDSIISSN